MTYLDRIATEDPADLIAAEVPAFLWKLKAEYTQFACVSTTYKQASANRALVERVTEELRDIWRLARNHDDAWRERLTAVNTTYRGHNQVASKRWQLLIERAPAKTDATEEEDGPIYGIDVAIPAAGLPSFPQPTPDEVDEGIARWEAHRASGTL